MKKKTILTTLAIAVAGTVGLVTLAGAAADPPEAARYPYDPGCPWGRISNGRGMLVRCISEAEARALLAGTPPHAPSTSASAAPSASAPEPPPVPDQPMRIEVGPVIADTGTLPEAARRLGLPKERYLQCVKKHGGLTKDKAEVRVRFLVRGRGRAEGVSVARRRGVSAKAASCIADVVDRRRVGTPAAPMVGATLIVKISK